LPTATIVKGHSLPFLIGTWSLQAQPSRGYFGSGGSGMNGWLANTVDPNIIVSALIAPAGKPAAIIDAWLDGEE
jgi:hypothetical protein